MPTSEVGWGWGNLFKKKEIYDFKDQVTSEIPPERLHIHHKVYVRISFIKAHKNHTIMNYFCLKTIFTHMYVTITLFAVLVLEAAVGVV